MDLVIAIIKLLCFALYQLAIITVAIRGTIFYILHNNNNDLTYF